ncbi:Zn-ribbon domain-containing OB-fold protein [Micromonospora sp. NPDC005161]
MADDIRLPAMDEDTRPFWEYARAGELRMQRCLDCGHVRWPPGPQCPMCWSTDSEWARLSGRGRVQGWVTYRRRYLEAFEPPYVVAAIRLEEGPTYQAGLVDPDRIVKGMPVESWFERVDEEVQLPMFRPADR